VTLTTSVAIGAPTDVLELFRFCRALLGVAEEVPFTHNASELSGCREIYNPGGIGAPAWLWIYYGADGPLPADTDEEADPADPLNGWACIHVTFDTAYGYTGNGGESCSDLHARLLTALGDWLDARDLPWKWQDEYTGEWHDRFDGLAEFGDAHRSSGAAAWFDDVVRPLIGGLR
jgi:hypothetical protein